MTAIYRAKRALESLLGCRTAFSRPCGEVELHAVELQHVEGRNEPQTLLGMGRNHDEALAAAEQQVERWHKAERYHAAADEWRERWREAGQ